MTLVTDSLVNAVTGLGTSRDHAVQTSFNEITHDSQQLVNAYRGSWMARKIVDIPALDSCRNWRDWQAANDQIEKIEAEEKRLNLKAKVLEARIKARLLGGAAVYFDTGQPAAEPLDPRTVKQGGIRFLTVFSREQLTATEIENDPLSPVYGQPKAYQIAGGGTGSATIHPSRLIRFVGSERIYSSGMAVWDWGDSALAVCLEAVKQAQSASANINNLIYEANIDVVSIKGLSSILQQKNGVEAVKELLKLNLDQKSILKAMVVDADNEVDRKAINFSTLPDLMDRFNQQTAGAADIPLTRFLGMSPGGMNATGESDLRNYYDRIQSSQTLEMGPAMSVFDEALIYSALGARDPAIHYSWTPLWQISEKEKADIFKIKADGARAIAGNGGTSMPLMPIEALSDALVNEFIEDGSLAGLEGAIEEYGKLSEQDDDGDSEEAALGTLPGPKAIPEDKIEAKDAAPRTLYVSRKLLNADGLIAWAKSKGFQFTVPADEMHVTIAYSRRPVDWMKAGDSWNNDKNGALTVSPGGARLVEPLGNEGAIVLLFNSSELSWRHEAIKRDTDATWDYPTYQPHVTFTLSEQGVDLAKVEPYRGKLVFGPEIFAEVDDSWSSKLTEE